MIMYVVYVLMIQKNVEPKILKNSKCNRKLKELYCLKNELISQ